MPSYQLTDVARLRIEELSFFIVVLLVCSLGVKWLWNLLARDFARLPRLGYGKAFGLTVLLGLFTVLVLSMISGAREVLTPGAWRRQGTTYRITDPANEPARRKGLESLRSVLWLYSQSHEGKFPQQDFIPEISDEIWQAPDEGRSRYIYMGGLAKDTPRTLLAVEPLAFGESRFALFTNGEIARVGQKEIGAEIAKAASR